MSALRCKRCGGSEYVKHGFVRGHQRYLCKGCGCHFTDTPPRGKPAAMKALAVSLYARGNMTFGMLGEQFGVSHVTPYRWVRKAAKALPPIPAAPEGDRVVVMDEMHHFVNGKKTPSGSGKPSI